MYNSGVRHSKRVDGDKAAGCYSNQVDDNLVHYDKEDELPEVVVQVGV